MLELRTIHTNGDWEEFPNSRIDQENKRLYPHAGVFAQIPEAIAA
jgi:hypothetical protein